VEPDAFVDALDEQRIVAAIAAAEARSRGEIRVHVADGPVEDVERAGASIFEQLGMTRTAERNGVLLFVAPASQRFAVLGDTGIHESCGSGFWAAVAEAMAAEFRAGRFTDGIVAGVQAVGDALARHFPRQGGETDRNELPDAVSRGRTR
jgi:uncharacterized membrane protein